MGFFLALLPVNVCHQPNVHDFSLDNTQLLDVVLALGLIMLLAATVLGCMKYRQMLEKSASYTPTVTAPQVAGSAVEVQAIVVACHELVV